MKTIVFLMILLFSSTFLFSQNMRIYYTLKYRPNDWSSTVKEQVDVLTVSKDISVFQSYKTLEFDSIVQNRLYKKINIAEDNYVAEIYGNKRENTFKVINNTKKQIFKDIIGGNQSCAYYEEEKMDWKITNEKSMFSNFYCQKAILNFGGRQWIAWFASEIPVQLGPYKFKELPGLIIKVHDLENNYQWDFIGLKNGMYDIYEKNDMEMQGWNTLIMNKKKFKKILHNSITNPLGNFMETFPNDEKTAEFMQRAKDFDESEKKYYYNNNNCIENESVNRKI